MNDMERKKVIILDMDETLEHGIAQSRYDAGHKLIMVLRLHLDKLIIKLNEAKQQGIDIVLCTTATNKWVERFLALKPEFKTIFDKILTRDNETECRNFTEEKYPIEFKARNENVNLEYGKPVTTFCYDAVLYIDDNRLEGVRLQILFGITHGKLEKDATYFSGFGFNGGRIAYDEMLRYKKIAKQNIEIANILREYIEAERNEQGCNMMCSAIDKFIGKEFATGLTLLDEEYSEDYNKHQQKIIASQKELQAMSSELKLDVNINKKVLKKFLDKDKKYPYEEYKELKE